MTDTDQSDFTEVYSLTTGRKQRVPVIWLDDPVLGRDFRKTPSQRELDGELGERPRQDSTVEEIDEYADAAGIDLPSKANKDARLAAVEAVFAPADAQEGLAPVELAPPVVDPLAPQFVAQGDPGDMPGVNADPTSTDGTEPTDETPAAGDEEN